MSKHFFRFVLILVFSGISSLTIAQVTSLPCNPANPNNGGNCPTDCVFAPTVERGCNCFDGIDNDGDGRIDARDPDCASYYGLEFLGAGSDCSITPDVAGFFAGFVGSGSSAQNTSDTQARILVGDVDGDGIPDIITTSKWNQQIRVVATSNNQADGKSTGQIKADYKTPGKSIFPAGNFYFDLDIAVADINRNGKGEMFSVVSKRKNAKAAPEGYWLVGFTYTAGELTPLWNAVALGNRRPGIIGIADFDGDGFAEVYFKDEIYAAETGKLLARGAGGEWSTVVNAAPVAVDLIRTNANLELVSGNYVYQVPNLSNRNPATPQALTVIANMNDILAASDKYFSKQVNDLDEYGIDNFSSTSVADFDGDGNVDVFLSGARGSASGKTAVYYWNVANSTVSIYEPPDATNPNGWPWGTGRINLGDVNGDGKLNATFVAGNRLFSLTTNAGGSLVPVWPQVFRNLNDSRSGIIGLTIYDFNNDGIPEVVYRDARELVIFNGADITDTKWSVICQSHTWMENPVIADINGDGATDICVPCNTSDNLASFKIDADIQQQALGQIRQYFSDNNSWLPTRQVWNQHGYYVVNIKDDLTLPFPQIDQTLVFGNDPCGNGKPGPQVPLNMFMNQVPNLGPGGCPIFPAPDLAFIGDNPNDPNVDPSSPEYFPAVTVRPPICGNLDLDVRFNITNSGEIPISDNVPVAFYDADPTLDPVVANLLFTTTITITNLQVGDTLITAPVTFNGPGSPFELFIVLYSDGTGLPLPASGSSKVECEIENNIYSVFVNPTPFDVAITSSPNEKCADDAQDNGELEVVLTRGGVLVTDYSDLAFQWYAGTDISNPIAGATDYNLIGVPEGDYTVVVRDATKDCGALPVTATVARLGILPTINVDEILNQTKCDPPDGKISVSITGGEFGYELAWFNATQGIALGPLGTTADNLVGGEYTVLVTGEDGCFASASVVVDSPIFPDAEAEVLQNVEDCFDPNSGIITARAIFNGELEDPAGYTFNWYVYDNSTDPGTRGSILPGTFGSGPTRTGLPFGFYQVEIVNNETQCTSTNAPFIEVTNSTIIPDVEIFQVEPQTSCDPDTPNGILSAVVSINGVEQTDISDFTFEWFRGDNTLPANLHTNVSGTRGEVANAVAGGGVFYTVKVSTALNCSSTDNFIIEEILIDPVLALVSTPNSICDPALTNPAVNFNGTITPSLTNGGNPENPADYTFRIYAGTTATGTPLEVITGSANPVFQNLDGGEYTIEAIHSTLSCNAIPQIVEVDNTQILPAITASATPSTNCDPALADGIIAVSDVDGSGITAPYTFEWFEGIDTNGTSIGTTASINQLQGGAGIQFTVLVTNQNSGCQNTFTLGLADASILPTVALNATDNSICDPDLTNPPVDFNGEIVGTPNHPVAGTFIFNWYTGVGTGGTQSSETGNTLGELPGDFYTATVLHEPTGCVSDPVVIEVNNIPDLPVLATALTPSTNCDPALANGEATVTLVNGAAPAAIFVFEWFEGDMPSGTVISSNASATALQGGLNREYTVQVTDQTNGCQNTVTVLLGDASVLPTLVLDPTDNTICDPALTNPAVDFNGEISGTPSHPEAGAFEFSWYTGAGAVPANIINGETAATILNLEGDFYTATTIHVPTGCISDPVIVEIKNIPDLPAITTAVTASTNCLPDGAPNGEATVTLVNGLAPTANFVFEWFEGEDTSGATVGNAATATALQGGIDGEYTVQVTNQNNGCQNTFTVLVGDASVLPVITLLQDPNTICDPNLAAGGVYDGVVTATITNAGSFTGGNFNFSWYEGIGTAGSQFAETGNILNELEGELYYTGTVKHDITGCESDPVNIEVQNDFDLPDLLIDVTASTNCEPDFANGSMEITSVDGGTNFAGYTYQWHSGENPDDALADTAPVSGSTTNFLQGVMGQGGTNVFFTVEVMNSLTGCINTQTQLMPDARVLPVITLAPTDNSSCVGFNGTVTATAVLTPEIAGHTFNFRWYNDNLGTNNELAGEVTNFIDALAGGFYTAIMRDEDTGCESDMVVAEVENFEYIPDIDIVVTDQTSCDENQLNSILAASIIETSLPDGINAGDTYTFTWVDEDGTGYPATSTINAIPGNLFYTLSVLHVDTGCENEETVFLPEILSIPFLNVTVTDIIDCNVPGLIEAEILINGLPLAPAEYVDYTFFWYRGNQVDLGNELNESSSILNQLDNGDPLPIGQYTVQVRHNTNFCQSQDVSELLNGPGPLFDIEASVVNAASSCQDDDGIITALVDGALVANTDYSFEWYVGYPTNTQLSPRPSFYTDPVVGFVQPILDVDQLGIANDPATIALGGDQNPPFLGSATNGQTLYGRTAGMYSVVVTRNDGCKEYATLSIPFVDEPVIVVTEIFPPKCDVDDGEITVEILLPGGNSIDDYQLFLYAGPNPDLLNGAIEEINVNTTPAIAIAGNSFPNLGNGYYTLSVREDPNVFTAGCFSTPVLVELRSSLPPVLNLLSSSVSTSCDDLVGDGALQISFKMDPLDPALDPPPPPVFYAGDDQPMYVLEVFNSNGDPVPGFDPDPTAYQWTGSVLTATIPGLAADTYTVTITSSENCAVTKDFTVNSQPTVPVLEGLVSISNAEFCDPLLETSARIEVQSIEQPDGGNELIADYNFEWSTDAAFGNIIYDADGISGGELLDNTKTTPPNNGIVTAGSYWVRAEKVTDNNASGGLGCLSAPFRANIVSNTVLPVIAMQSFGNTACDGAFEGSIRVDVSTTGGPGDDPTVDYDYSWVTATASLPADGTYSGDATIDGDFLGLEDGVYTLTAINNLTGCQRAANVTILPISPPVFTLTASAADQTICIPDGFAEVTNVRIDGVDDAIGNFDYAWFAGSVNPGNELDDPGNPGNPFTGININVLAAGTYFVKAIRNTDPGSGCESAAVRLDIQDKSVDPDIAFTLVPNTSCNLDFDGAIIVEASHNSGGNFDFEWQAGIPADAIMAGALDVPGPYRTEDEGDVVAPGVYQIRVFNINSGCERFGQTTVLNQPLPVSIVNVTAINPEICAPDGSIQVLAVSPTVVGDFTYTWYAGSTASAPLEDGANVIIDASLLDVNNYANIGPGTYFVVGVKNTGTTGGGAGCETAPFRIDLIDESENPTVSFTTLANTACNGDFDAAITVNASHPFGGNFDFVWNIPTLPAGAAVADALDVASPYSTTATDIIAPGTYNLMVRHLVSQCEIPGVVSVLDQPLPVEILNVIKADPEFCAPDGSIEVTAVNPANLADYTFQWFRNAPTSTPLEDPGNVLIDGVLLDVNNLPDIGPGTFFVVGIKNPGTAGGGAGCETAPFRMDLIDRSINPSITFTTIANTACDGNFDGEIAVNASHPLGGNFDFVWDLVNLPDDAVMAGALDIPGPYNTSNFADVVAPGEYRILVRHVLSQCEIPGIVSVQDQPQPLDILDVIVNDQLICFADGSIEVLLLSEGAVNDFEFEWRRSSATANLLEDGNADVIVSELLNANNYADMGAGTYFVSGVKVTDGGLGCRTNPFRVEVLDLSDNPEIDFSFVPNSSCDPTRPNGLLVADARERDGNNAADYSFVWQYNSGVFPPEIANPVSSNNSSNIDGALDGMYTLTVVNTNVTGCQVDRNFNLQLDLTLSIPNIITVDRFNPFDCLGSGEAEVVSISVGGGPAITGAALITDFEFEWYNDTFPGTARAETTPTLVDLQPGKYFVLVKDLETDCVSDPKEVAILDANIVLPVVKITQTALQISCVADLATASLLATADDDIEPNYAFTWYKSLDLSGDEIGDNSTIDELFDGEYSVLVRSNITGCESAGFFIIPDQSPLFTPLLSTASEPLNLCVGADGVAVARVINFDNYPFPFDFTTDLYFNGNPDFNLPPDVPDLQSYVDGNGVNFPLNFRQTGLGIGTYTFRLFDNNTGCEAIASVEVADNRVNPTVAVVAENPLTNCDPDRANGQLSATADGGKVGGYEFVWFAGTTIPEPTPANPLASNNKLIGQTTGAYSVRVTNNQTGCFIDGTGNIVDGIVLPPIPTAFVIEHRRNCLDPDGIVAVNVNVNGQPNVIDYFFNWYNGNAVTNSSDFNEPIYRERDIGFYTVTARELKTGCVSPPATVEVLDFRVTPEVSFDVFPSRCLAPTGALELLVLNNFSIQEVTWIQASTGVQIFGSTAIYDQQDGLYIVNVVSTDGCESTVEVVIPTEITSYNGISANGDGLNDFFEIDCIDRFPNNNVKIFNRVGVKVYEADGYNNQDVIFRGVGERGVYMLGRELPDGTYFYVIDKRDGSKPVAGYLELIR